MSHISVFQPDDPTSPGPVVLSRYFLALKDADSSSSSLLPELQRFLDEKGYHGLDRLRGSQAAEAADFFDKVRNPDSTIVSSCDQSTALQLITTKLRDYPEYRRHTMRALRSMSGSWGVLPASYTLQGEAQVSDGRKWTTGGYSEVWRGTLGCERVAIKVITTGGAPNPDLKRLKKVGVVT